MRTPSPKLRRLVVPVLAAVLIAGCGADLPSPMVWQARGIAIVPTADGRVVRAIGVRNGLSLLAERATNHPVAAGDLLLDEARESLWLRDGQELIGLALPSLGEFVRIRLPPGTERALLALRVDGGVALDGGRYVLSGATWSAGGEPG